MRSAFCLTRKPADARGLQHLVVSAEQLHLGDKVGGVLLLHNIVFILPPASGADIPYPERCWDAPFSSPGTPAPPWDAAAAPLRRPISPLRILAYCQPSKCKNKSYSFAFIIPIFFSLSTTTKGLCPKFAPKSLDSLNCICYSYSINCIISEHSCIGG